MIWDPKRLETPENLEDRADRKERLGGIGVKPEDVVLAATNTYQSEFGHWFEDEGWDDLWAEACELYLKHRDQAKDNGELYELLVRDLHGDCPTVHEQMQIADYGPKRPYWSYQSSRSSDAGPSPPVQPEHGA